MKPFLFTGTVIVHFRLNAGSLKSSEHSERPNCLQLMGLERLFQPHAGFDFVNLGNADYLFIYDR